MSARGLETSPGTGLTSKFSIPNVNPSGISVAWSVWSLGATKNTRGSAAGASAISADPAVDPTGEQAGRRIDPYALGEALTARGWHLDRLGPPPSLHLTVSAGNAMAVDDFLVDLEEASDEVRGGATGAAAEYSTLE